jgi:hypothetical protein
MSERVKTLILAGTHDQAVAWRRAHGYSQQEGEYIHDVRALRGRSTKGVPRVIVGTFYQRADWNDIQEALLISDLHERVSRPDVERR